MSIARSQPAQAFSQRRVGCAIGFRVLKSHTHYRWGFLEARNRSKIQHMRRRGNGVWAGYSGKSFHERERRKQRKGGGGGLPLRNLRRRGYDDILSASKISRKGSQQTFVRGNFFDIESSNNLNGHTILPACGLDIRKP